MGTAAAETDEWADDAPAAQRPARAAGAWIAGLLLLGVSTVVGCRIADTDGITPVPQVLAFLPWLLAPTGLALLLAGLARWRIGLAWGVAALAAIAWFIEPYGKTTEAKGTPLAELRVLTSNVQFGQATDELIKTIRSERPDLVFVEECENTCDEKLTQAFGAKGTTDTADTTDTTDTPGAKGTYPYRQAVEGYGSDGSVILSRYPLKPAPGVRGTMGMPGATADVKGNEVRVQLAHPMPPLPAHVDDWRRELDALRDYAAADKTRPTILAGDFNASQDHAAFRRILDTGLRDGARLTGDSRTPTWPARTTPAFGAQIDHVLVSQDFSANRARFLDLENTDHRSVLLDLTLHERG
ncbi:endonuclease/exonuclease/phosphatase family protein [Streptomyces sp. HC44]|uniref:Endonuclease/exonuclease/phosphatase family protein n=1 Tax=Streptomyces scabichelini TaxID=2711217 RepID=A0A6G4VLZ1_9ACTN|nr:endonuclease/exonuclease/phosphatase family protein [Streptomyces scabichelini]NGO14991.1 endonuclease/exonuclease/phosphatase family protein [Streptomyces scabichelini]